MNSKTIVALVIAAIGAAGVVIAIRGATATADDHPKGEAATHAKVAPGHSGHTPTAPAAKGGHTEHAGHAEHTGHGAPAAEVKGEVIDLKNDTCPVMGGKALPDVYTDYQGVRIHWCCPGCDATFLKDPAKYLKKLGIDDLDEFKRKHAAKGSEGHADHSGHAGHAAATEAKGEVIDLKNDTCPVMGGKALPDVYTDYQGVRIHWCCPGCDATFLKDPAKYLKKLGIDDLDEFKRKHAAKGSEGHADHSGHAGHAAATEAKGEVIDLKNDTCPVMGGKALPDVYTDYQGVRIHWCCPGCDATFLKDPAKYLKKLGIDDLDEFKRKHAAKGD